VRLLTARLIIGVVLVLLGGVWFFQGIDAIGGSAMSGSSFWAIAGIVVVAVGIGLVLAARRQRS
jgi:uncharacterized membrane protein YjjP (DUF1212 family)